MFATTLLAAALAQATVAARIEEQARSILTAELLDRPAELTMPAFIEQIVREAGASEWQRQVQESSSGDFRFQMIGLRSEHGALILIAPALGSGSRVCRVRRLREGAPAAEESDRVTAFCIAGIRPQP
jgi:hypothetical protein